MAGLVPAIHVFLVRVPQELDARYRPGMTSSSQTHPAGRPQEGPGYFFTLLASILIDGSSNFVENAVSTANGFSMPR